MKTTTIAAIAALAWAATVPAAEPTVTGPSSSQSPYLVPTAEDVRTVALLTVGDAVGGYRLAGIPDGLGAFSNHDGTFTVLLNHELGATAGVVRAHGGRGSFVSRWIVDAHDFRVVAGEDLIRTAVTWDFASGAWKKLEGAALNFNRFCSADLPDESAFYDRRSGRGTRERIFMNGEEAGTEGRAFAHVATGPLAGTSYDLPWLGRFSWENAVAKPETGPKTVVAGLDDSGGGQVYFYVGEKTWSGDPIEAAGLRNGVLYGLKIELGAGAFVETNASAIPDGTRFSLVALGDVARATGAQLEAASVQKQVSALQRPEDGAWSPRDARRFYFQTTASFAGTARLWELRFDDARDVTKGGTLRIVLQSPAFDASLPNAAQAGPRMLDNLTVNRRGEVISVEDVGGNDYVGSVWQTDPVARTTRKVAEHDRSRFTAGAPNFLTIDEEASGVIPLRGIPGVRGGDWYLIDVQAHYASGDPATVEGGQLLAIRIPSPNRRHDEERESDD